MNTFEALHSNRFLDELMANIIVAGGRKIQPPELRAKTLGEIIDLIYPNGLRLQVYRENFPILGEHTR